MKKFGYMYSLECSEKKEGILELAYYKKGKPRYVIDSIEAAELEGSRKLMWKFIEKNIGSSSRCDIDDEALKLIFGKWKKGSP